MVALTLLESFVKDRIEEFPHRSMEQLRRRCPCFQCEIHLHRVSLVRADTAAIFAQCEALLVAVAHNVFEHLTVEWLAVSGRRGDQVPAVHPALRVKRDADLPRIVPED